ncbi:helix-turn-helix transcriptional regulator [uncultured Megasphaera sp.]|uniref:helix-turn-helix domain-containing protein n=1 Tax=uncultured Megasphaera sp. TaxID=165188 RepID=UPI0025F64926|nr:helix-turn-helix transcriptional regulator [uncultured Megasphaera sp.]
MILTNKLIGIMAEKGISQAEMARRIGITPKTFYEKMSKGVFGSDEIEIMVKELNMTNPWDIFFAS